MDREDPNGATLSAGTGVSSERPEPKEPPKPPKPEDDPRFQAMEEISNRLVVERAQEIGVSPESMGLTSDAVAKAKEDLAEIAKLSPQEEEPEPVAEKPTPKEEKRTEAPKSLDEEKLRVIDSSEDIPLETLDLIAAAKSVEEVLEIEGKISPRKPIETEELVEVKIRGKVTKVPLKDVIAGYQKTEAADQYLSEASQSRKETAEALKEAKRMKEELDTLLKTPPKPEAPQHTPQPVVEPPPKDASIDPSKVKGWVHAIQYGDEDEGTKAMTEWQNELIRITRQRPPQMVDSSKRDDEVRSTVRQEMATAEIRGRFFTEFKDIVEDPDLFGIVNRKVDERLQKGDNGLDYDVYKQVGREVQDWWKKGKGAKAEGPDNGSPPKPEPQADVSLRLKEVIEDRRKKKLELDTLTGVQMRSGGSTEEELSEDQARRKALAETAGARGQSFTPPGY